LPSTGGAAGDLLEGLQQESGLIHESSLIVFRLWMQFGGPNSPLTPQEIADMDASLALDMATLLRLYRRVYDSEMVLMGGMRQETNLMREKDVDPMAAFEGEGVW
jgi:hypothetical protein